MRKLTRYYVHKLPTPFKLETMDNYSDVIRIDLLIFFKVLYNYRETYRTRIHTQEVKLDEYYFNR